MVTTIPSISNALTATIDGQTVTSTDWNNIFQQVFNHLNNKVKVAVDELQAATVTVIPEGGIILWSGLLATVPSGFAVCDGVGTIANGTNVAGFTTGAGHVAIPDLRGLFVMGASKDANKATGGFVGQLPGTGGGSTNHTHAATGLTMSTASGTEVAAAVGSGASRISHTHTMAGATAVPTIGATTPTSPAAGSSGAPSYMAIFYIIKLS